MAKKENTVYHFNTLCLHPPIQFHNPLHTPFSVVLEQNQQDFIQPYYKKTPKKYYCSLLNCGFVLSLRVEKKTCMTYFQQKISNVQLNSQRKLFIINRFFKGHSSYFPFSLKQFFKQNVNWSFKKSKSSLHFCFSSSLIILISQHRYSLGFCTSKFLLDKHLDLVQRQSEDSIKEVEIFTKNQTKKPNEYC